MDGQADLKLSVQNFGPIKEGEFELKPLTIFIGPNNSGKSYMATLVYVLCQAISQMRKLNERGYWDGSEFWEDSELIHSVDAFEEFVERFQSISLQREVEKRDVTWEEMPANFRKIFSDALEEVFDSLRTALDEEITDYFGCRDINELIRQTSGEKTPLIVHLNRKDDRPALLTYRLDSTGKASSLDCSIPDISSWAVPDIGKEEAEAENVDYIFKAVVEDTWDSIVTANGFSMRKTYYLPGARSGVLQGWQLFASLAIQSMRRSIGIRRMETPAFTGVAADFLQVLLESQFQRQRRGEFEPIVSALEILEDEVLRGRVFIRDMRSGPPIIIYNSGNVRLPLQRASSMIGELAPLDLWIKNFLQPGDLLVIDEPEAHQHPENQRKIAQVMVRLARAGVKVLCTTHSSMILHQTSNHLLATEASAKVREELGFTEDDLLKPDEVGVYLFDNSVGDGTTISAVPIEPGFGISEEEFVRVSEAIGDETFRLSMSLPDVEERSG